MALRTLVVTSLLLAMVAAPAVAQTDVYDNGPTDGRTYAWTINLGYIVSDSFNYVNEGGCYPYYSCSINGLSFAAWLFPGDTLQSVEVSITSEEFGGTTYFDQTVNFFQSDCVRTYYNGEPFDLCNETGNFQRVYLNTGTYWLNLQNAIVDTGDPVYWDQNSGPSQASENTVGTVPSESFTLLGDARSSTCRWCGDTPEPGSLLLVVSGLGAFGVASKLFLS